MKFAASQIRSATITDLKGLLHIENTCFSSDRLSKRSFRHYIQDDRSELLVAVEQGQSNEVNILGYGLIWCHRGTRLARLYSLAVLPTARGKGIAQSILGAIESAASARSYLFMRLEVASNNDAAIHLYKAHGYRVFGAYENYYKDHSNALRMQKTIRQVDDKTLDVHRNVPWYQQTTGFTCGPASLMMAMASLDSSMHCHQKLELDIWREATTIFMTSGHGGCHPFGLALAAKKRGFSAKVSLNSKQTLFIEGVRSDDKKKVLTVVHEQFLENCHSEGVTIRYEDVTQFQVESWLEEGFAVLVLISTYRLDGKKSPHWVVVTGIDPFSLYVHDPDVDDTVQMEMDCQYIPIAREDFSKMSAFGSNRLRVAVAIKPDDFA